MVLVVASADRAYAQTGSSEPCQPWVDAVQVHRARKAANPNYPQHWIDRAEQNLSACMTRSSNQSFYNNFHPGNDRVSNTPSSKQVRTYTYTPIENPYRGWHACQLAGVTGSQCSGRNMSRSQRAGTNYQNPLPPVTEEEATKTQEARDRVESWEGPVDWYNPPHGTGPNGEVHVPCDDRGHKARTEPGTNTVRVVRDSDGNIVTTGQPPPAGQICR